MKKVILALAVVFSVALVSCGSKDAKTEDTTVMDTPVETVVEDTNATEDSAKAEAPADAAAAEEAPATDSAAK